MEGSSEGPGRGQGADVRRECELPYCSREATRLKRTLCEGHYYQQYKGKEFTPLIERITGDRCQVEGCDAARGSGRYCRKHDARIRRHGDPHFVIHQRDRALPRGEDHPGWVEDPGYRLAHQRIRSSKGSASRHACANGCGRQARQWAYSAPRGSEDRMPFSTDPDDYVPLCIRCHKGMDIGRIDRVRHAESKPPPGWWTEAIDLYEQGLGCNRISGLVGREPSTVWKALVRSGVQMRPRPGRNPREEDMSS